MIPFEQAFALVTRHSSSEVLASAIERLPIADALGRIVSSSKTALIDVPGYNNSAMDGYAVRAAEILLEQALPVSQRIAAGDAAQPLAAHSVARIFTGAMIPDGADAVILQEDSVQEGSVQEDSLHEKSVQESSAEQAGLAGQDSEPFKQIRFTELPEVGQHIRLAGQDIAAGVQVVARGQRLSSVDIGLLASVGIAELECYKPLRVAFFSTGDELKNPGQDLAVGQIYNSNRYFLAARIRELGAIPVDLGCCPDSAAATEAMLLQASEQADCIVTTGGMSVGEEDYVRQSVESLGSILFWKIAMKPGKPVAFGEIQGTPFFGLPGNPVSSFVTFHLLVRPWLLKRMGYADWCGGYASVIDEVAVENVDDSMPIKVQPQGLTAVSTFAWHNGGKRLDFLRGDITVNQQGQLQVSQFQNQSSGVLSSIAASNVLIPVKPGQSLTVGEVCKVISLAAVDPFV